MTLQQRRWLLLGGVLIVAVLLAFPLRDTVYQVVVVPAAYLLWWLNLVYRSFSQGTWWAVVVFIVFVVLLFSLMPRPTFRPGRRVKSKLRLGQVEALAASLGKARGGIYFKWLVANRLGKLAYQMLLHREVGRPRSVFAPLLGEDWQPAPELQKYLETGLHGSFADFPGVDGSGRPTPLDFDIAQAVEFLETRLENGHSPQRH